MFRKGRQYGDFEQWGWRSRFWRITSKHGVSILFFITFLIFLVSYSTSSTIFFLSLFIHVLGVENLTHVSTKVAWIKWFQIENEIQIKYCFCLKYLTKDSNRSQDIRPRDSISRCSTHKANNISVQREVREDRVSKLRNANRPFSRCKMPPPSTRIIMDVLSQSLHQHWYLYLNPLKTKRRLLYLKTQFVPRSKHFSSRL